MKNLQKLFLPGMVILVAFIIYFTYFSRTEKLGSFSDFDTNSNVNLDITVGLVKEKGIARNEGAGTSTFYAVDKDGREVTVSAPLVLPQGIEAVDQVILHGHLHKDHFHATEVRIK